LKRVARKKSQPLFAYKLNIQDIPLEILGQQFNIHDLEEWEKISHIVINEDGMKFPVQLDDSEGMASIAHRFIQNPAKVEDLDELYDAFEVNKGTNVKYVLICNPGNHASP
jgi:hypothetical protein